MADLPTRSKDTITQTIVAGIQGRAKDFIDFSKGSPLLAISEAIAGVGLWLQAISLKILTATRLATAVGIDVDTFVADFMPGVVGSPITLPNGQPSPRLPDALASGTLTFVRFSLPTSGAPTSPFVPTGATVQTNDGSQSVTIVADATNVNFSTDLDGYSMPSGSTTLSVTAQAQTPGPGGNIGAGTATVMTTPIVGVDQVSNSLAFVGGQLSETSAALKARFVLWMLGLSRGNVSGVESALANLNVAIAYKIVDQETYAGADAPGYFYVVVDDGSGTPSDDFIATAALAVSAAKALGVNFSLFKPNLVQANVSGILGIATGYKRQAVVGQVSALVTANILALGLGVGLDVYTIADWAKSVPGVAPTSGITALTLNGLSGDAATLEANEQNRIMPGTIAFS